MTGVELLEKLVPLIPPTYANLTRFHGVFAPTSRMRTQVVPRPPTPTATEQTTPPSPSAPPLSHKADDDNPLDWAALLKRVFAVDVLECARCRGPMRVIACIEEHDLAKKI